MAPLRAAIAGTGFIGGVHARSARLAGGRDRRRRRLLAASAPQDAAAALGAERAFDSAEEMVRDPDVDVVHICTPNHLHLPLAEAALAAGKHVICEKPLALDGAGAQRLVDAASGSGLQAAVPFVYRYYPTVREARERVGSGRDRRPAPDARQLPAGLAAAAPRTGTGASTSGRAAPRAPSPTSARTGATWPSSSPASASPASAPGCSPRCPSAAAAEGRQAFAAGGGSGGDARR